MQTETEKLIRTLYNSDPYENGFVWVSHLNTHIYIDGMSIEEMEALSEEEIDRHIEEMDAYFWHEDDEWDDFARNIKSQFDRCVGVVLHGRVKAWDGWYNGGKVYYGEKATFGNVFHDLWKDADNMEITLEDGDMVISTYDHDGGITFTLRFITEDDYYYYEENPDDLSDSEMGAKLLERGIKADKFLEGYI